jgi:ATPase subunit of ABC transporter with duplicated ATPase domains
LSKGTTLTVLDDLPPWDPHEQPPHDDEWDDTTRTETLAHAAAADQEFKEAEEHSQLAHLGAIPDNVRELPRKLQIRHAVSASRTQRAADIGLLDLDAFLAEPDPEYDWLIPGLLERGDRVIVTGQEGKGKSTLLRQIGVQVAAGIHPFTLDDIVPTSWQSR